MKDQTNIIQFPKPSPHPATASQTPNAGTFVVARKATPSLLVTVMSLLAIALATGATNSSTFRKTNEVDLASTSGNRILASIDERAEVRDAVWEKSVAESLASKDEREVASISIGHEATQDETLRYGVLERKYTILRDLQRNEIESIILQGSGSEPSSISNRAEFLAKYGKWMSEKYAFSELKSSEPAKDRRHELFTVFDANRKAYAIAHFELDNYQRLLSFRFEPL
jgi:hypothetical protein